MAKKKEKSSAKPLEVCDLIECPKKGKCCAAKKSSKKKKGKKSKSDSRLAGWLNYLLHRLIKR